jgi:plastocyanin
MTNYCNRVATPLSWVNMDDEPHTVLSDTGLFRSNGLDTNEAYSYRFDQPGTYHIACSIHPRMVATIVVE